MSDDEDSKPALGISGGLAAFGGGIGFVVGTPRIWGYAVFPFGVMVFLTILLTALMIWGGVSLSSAILGEPNGTWGKVGTWIVTALLSLVSFLIAMVLALSVAQPISCFALEAIAHAQEEALTGRALPKPPFFTSLFASLRVVLTTVIVGGTLLTLLFIIGIVFPPAAIVTVPLKFLVCAWLLAWDFLDYPMGLRCMGLRARLRWVRRNFDAFSAFGIAWATFVIIPGLVLILLPMGVAGATRMVVEDDRHGL